MEHDKNSKIKIVKEIQLYVEQMKLDDIENSPDAADEMFVCNCCGGVRPLAGSMLYVDAMFCNDCVLIAETSMALNKVKDPRELISLMDEKRFENLYIGLFGDPEQNEDAEDIDQE